MNKTIVRRLASLIAALLALGAPMAAHHAFAAEFDSNRPLTLSGTVSKVVWLNPHARFLVSVAGPRGSVTTWELVLGSPNVLIRQGWARDTIKKGDMVNVNGYAARDGSHLAVARSVRLNGRNLVFGPSGDGGPER